MNRSFTISAILAFSLAFVSCGGSKKKEDNGIIVPPVEADRVVYVAGVEYHNIFSLHGYPVVWKNGTAQRLTSIATGNENNGAVAYSIFVSGDAVYVAGESTQNVYGPSAPIYTANLWVDGVPRELSGGTSASSVFVSGSDVYVAGRNDSGPVVWKNGTPQALVGGRSANSVFVSGSDVYVGGIRRRTTDSVIDDGVIWKNGTVLYTLVNDEDERNRTYVSSIYVSGSDVYAAGYVLGRNTNSNLIGKARLWKNGNVQTLDVGDQDSSANSVAVSGNDVYVAGMGGAGMQSAMLWKNGVAQRLGGNGEAKSVFVFGGDVYVCGEDFDGEMSRATVWKNGTIYQRMARGAAVYSIFVK